MTFLEAHEDWTKSFYCGNCGRIDKDDFAYNRTVANGEVWICKHCEHETLMGDEPNEDTYVDPSDKEDSIPVFKCDLDEFCEEIFHEMESIQDGNRAHIVEFNADTKTEAADKILKRLKPFIIKQLTEK